MLINLYLLWGWHLVIGCDWQLEPKDLEKTNWLQGISGTVIATELGTCEPDVRILDFFVVSKGQAKNASGTRLPGTGIATHTLVMITLQSDKKQPTIEVVFAPRAFSMPPAGCLPPAPPQRWETVRSEIGRAREQGTNNGGKAVDEAWVFFCKAAELEACDICQVPLADLGKHQGRHQEIKTKTVMQYSGFPHGFPLMQYSGVPHGFPRTSREGACWKGIADLLLLASKR